LTENRTNRQFKAIDGSWNAHAWTSLYQWRQERVSSQHGCDCHRVGVQIEQVPTALDEETEVTQIIELEMDEQGMPSSNRLDLQDAF
jgi:hypothetical protein